MTSNIITTVGIYLAVGIIMNSYFVQRYERETCDRFTTFNLIMSYVMGAIFWPLLFLYHLYTMFGPDDSEDK